MSALSLSAVPVSYEWLCGFNEPLATTYENRPTVRKSLS